MNEEIVANSIMIWWLTKNKKPLKYPIDTIVPGYFKYTYFANPATIISDLISKELIDVKSGYVNITESGKLYKEENKAIIWAHRNRNAISDFEEDFAVFQQNYKNSGFVTVEDFFVDCLEHAEQRCFELMNLHALSRLYFSLWKIYSKYYKNKNERIFKIVLILFFLNFEEGFIFAPGQVRELKKLYSIDNEILEIALKSDEYLTVLNLFENPKNLHIKFVNEFYKQCL